MLDVNGTGYRGLKSSWIHSYLVLKSIELAQRN